MVEAPSEASDERATMEQAEVPPGRDVTCTPKKAGRPRLPEGKGKSVDIPIRTTPALGGKASRMAKAAGISRNAWIEALIRNARR